MKKIYTFLFLLIIVNAAHSQVVSTFTPLVNITQKGDITHASNTVLYCNGSNNTPTNGCTAANQAPPGSGTPFPTGATVATNSAWNNNTFTMQNFDQDGAGVVGGINSFNSSNARLTLGTTGGCGVVYATLVWGGNINTGQANYAKRDSVYFRFPGSTNYVGLKADSKIDNASGSTTYACYKDVTNYVKAAGTGTYWVANVVCSTGVTNMCGGWSLVVAYSDPTLALRNLVIYKGYVNITNAAAPAGPQEFPISGFYTPPSPAPVNIKLGAFAIEGDRGTLGDSLKFKGNIGSGNFEPVYNSTNFQDNFFNSSISREDTAITRLPAFTNALGYDADIVTLDNSTKKYLGNGASSAIIRLTTSGDQYWVFLLTSAIDVFEPDIRLEKSYTNITNPGATSAAPGDIIEYTITASNKGSDPADSLIVTDSLYGGGIFVPGSMKITQGANIGTKTDAIGDDQMDFDGTANVVKARLGLNANGTVGGKLKNTGATDSISTFKFQVKVSADCGIFKCTDTLYNMAYAEYKGQTSQGRRTLYSAANGVDPITGCPLSGPVKTKIDVNPVCPPYPDTSITACSPYNLSTITPYRPGFTTFYNSSGVQVTQATASGTYYAVRTLYPGFTWLPACKDSIVITFTAPCTLPINLIDFTAKYTADKTIKLDWRTSAEVNNLRFDIERSVDGITFNKIGSVVGNLNSSTTKVYSFVDNNYPKLSKLHYRLVQVDISGAQKISAVKSVALPADNTNWFSINKVVPNPVKDVANVNIFASINEMVFVKVFNVMGKQVYSNTLNLKAGSNNLYIDMNNFASGLYLLEVMDDKQAKVVSRIMK